MKDIVIFGVGGLGREVAELIEDINEDKKIWNLLGWLDGNSEKHGEMVHCLPVLGDASWTAKNVGTSVIVAVGGPKVKRNIVQSLGDCAFGTLIHPNVKIRSRVRVGEGSIICEGTQITTNIEIKRHVVINIGCTVGHDTIIEDFSTIAPGVNDSGNVSIDEGVDVGTGSRIIQGIRIGAWSIVGAGAVVSRDLASNITAVGVPAKVIKERENGWHLS